MSAAPYDPQARRDTQLAVTLKDRIRRDGQISVADYMQACLQDPEHGYYRNKAAIGAQADFITAPEISQIFGELIGLWCAVVWQQMGSPNKVTLVELGPGRGTLMQDALRAMAKVRGLQDALTVRLVESNMALAAEQRLRLEGRHLRIHWHPAIDEVTASIDGGAAMVIANEWLDTIAPEQIALRDGVWRRRMVGLDADSRLLLVDGPASEVQPIAEVARTARDGDVVEIADFAVDMIAPLAAIATRATSTAALLIDYGHETSCVGDTMQAVRNHRTESVLESPGEADISVQVDFASLAASATAAGLQCDGPTTQTEFLGRLGVIERASKLMAANPSQAGAIEQAVARLIAPNGMGTRFKAVGLRTGNVPPLPGFPG